MDPIVLLKMFESFAVSDYVRSSPWAYPILETVHMFGLGLVFGGMFAFDLRLLGVHRDLSIVTLAHHVLPWVWFGFLINVVSGVLLFLSDPVTFGLNLAFQIKIGMLCVIGMSVLWFQRYIFPQLGSWDRKTVPPRSARALAALSILLWMAVITAGRMIAYVPEPEIQEDALTSSTQINGTTHNPDAVRKIGHARWRAPDVIKI